MIPSSNVGAKLAGVLLVGLRKGLLVVLLVVVAMVVAGAVVEIVPVCTIIYAQCYVSEWLGLGFGGAGRS